MIRRRTFAAARAAAALALTIAVGGCAPEPTGRGQTTEAPQGPGLTGILVEESGEPLSFRNVMACTQAVCFYTDTDRSGRFTFLLDEPIRGVIKTDEDLRSKPRRTSPMVPVTVGANEFLDVGEVIAPGLPAGTPVDPSSSETQTVDAGDGLSLTLAPAAIQAAAGQEVRDIAARRLPDRALPRYASLAGGPIIAVYALHPFAAKIATPTAVRIDSDLPEGTRVSLRVIDEIDGTLAEAVPAVVRNGSIATSAGEGITTLTHLMVVGEATD